MLEGDRPDIPLLSFKNGEPSLQGSCFFGGMAIFYLCTAVYV